MVGGGRDLNGGGGRGFLGPPPWIKAVLLVAVLTLLILVGVKGCSSMAKVEKQTRYEVLKPHGQ